MIPRSLKWKQSDRPGSLDILYNVRKLEIYLIN